MCSYSLEVNPEILYRQVQYLVAEEDWAKFGKEAKFFLEGKSHA